MGCQVECDPLCHVSWSINDVSLTHSDPDVSITDEIISENNEIFSSMLSTLVLTQEALDDINDIDTNVTISCESTGNDFGPSVSSSTNLNIEYSPQNMNVSVENLEIEEDEEMESILCWAEAFPGPSYYWTLNNEVVAEGDSLKFPNPIKRSNAGEYLCHAANKHGEEVASVAVQVLYKPECSVSFELNEDEIVFHCQASAFPNDLVFSWQKANESSLAENTELLKVKLSNETNELDEYFCIVSNTVGQSSPCSTQVNLPLLVTKMEPKELLMIIIICSAVVALLLLVALATCYYCYKKGGTNKDQNKPENTKQTDEQPHSDKSFYENLPFQGLKNPPKQVINPTNVDDNMDYADADYKDLYVEGPKGFRKLPENKTPKITSSHEKVNGL